MSMRRMWSLSWVVAVKAVSASLVASAPAQAAPTCAGERATIIGSERADRLRGTRHRDVFVAKGGDDVIIGRGGRDVVCAGRGSDVVDGGCGDDRLFGGLDRRGFERETGLLALFGDFLRGGSGNDRLVPGLDRRRHQRRYRDEMAWDQATHGVRVDLRRQWALGQGRDTFRASSWHVRTSRHADVIVGSFLRDDIDAEAGADLIRSGAGNDFITTDASGGNAANYSDKVFAGPGDDDASGVGGSDLLHGGRGNDRLAGFGSGPDRIFAGPGNDLVDYSFVLTGRQRLSGGPGLVDRVRVDDWQIDNAARAPASGTLALATGALTYQFDTRRISLTAYDFEHATLTSAGQLANWQVRGTEHSNGVNAGGTGGTRLKGLAGDDDLVGSDSDDWYDGGPGTDTAAFMGNGTDTCISVEQFRASAGPCPRAHPKLAPPPLGRQLQARHLH